MQKEILIMPFIDFISKQNFYSFEYGGLLRMVTSPDS
jgi:hypothetical protein